MKNQRGQALVEFALIVPIFFISCFAMIYFGILFMDYLQYNNAARGVARAISIGTDSERTILKADFENNTSEYINQLTKLYDPHPTVEIDDIDKDVTVTVKLALNPDNEGLRNFFEWLNIDFPPTELNLITVVMPLENNSESEGEV